MATAVTSKKLFSNALIQMWDHDPGTTDATITSPDGGTTKRYVALQSYEGFAVVAMSSTLTGAGITLLEIVAATDSSGTNATAVLSSGTVAADAVGDYVVLEVTAAQVREVGAAAGYNFTHVGARLTLANAADESVVTYIRHTPKFAYADLTANAIAA